MPVGGIRKLASPKQKGEASCPNHALRIHTKLSFLVCGRRFGKPPAQIGSGPGPRFSYAFTHWMAGGGVKAGVSYGQSDEFGFNAVVDPVHVHDFQATVLHQLGIDHERLTFKFQGRHYRLTDVHGQVVRPILNI